MVASKVRLKDMVMVATGIVDGAKGDLKPTFEVFVKRKVEWFPGVEGSLKIQDDPA